MVNNRVKKSRTAKSKGKGLKLKWWYVLPVIVLVAGAGYLIVRFSQASSLAQMIRGVDYMSGGKSTTKIDGKTVRIIGGKPVRIKYGAIEGDRNWLGDYKPGTFTPIGYSRRDLDNKNICIEFWAGTGTRQPAKVTIKMVQNTFGPNPFGSYQTKDVTTRSYTVNNTWATKCLKFDTGLATGLQADITIYNGETGNKSSQPLVGVRRVYYRN